MNPETKPDVKIDPRVATDFPKYIATSITDQIKQADTKAFGTLGIIGIITSALLSRLSALKGLKDGVPPLWLIFFAIASCLIILAIKASLGVVYPRLTVSKKEDMTYFRDISSLTQQQFIQWGKDMSTEGVITETYKNAYNLATIANKKYIALRKAMLFTGAALICAIAVIILS